MEESPPYRLDRPNRPAIDAIGAIGVIQAMRDDIYAVCIHTVKVSYGDGQIFEKKKLDAEESTIKINP